MNKSPLVGSEMLCHQIRIVACKPVHNSIIVSMDYSIKTSCDQSHSGPIDLLISIAVIGALGFLLYPSATFTYMKIKEISKPFTGFMSLVVEEVTANSLIYVCLAASTVCLTVGLWGILACMSGKKCGNADCKGLRSATKFDIEIENEDCVKSTSSVVTNKGVFDLALAHVHNHHLETELRKMAPLNGRAVLVYRLKCGCSAGRMEVPGPRKTQKMKK